ncbi:MAG: ComEC/Rec2 family competence protein, partial [Clostridiales Family XIII bacterium]|nr:ComEC/Rec2 family competence protein [Clostridiales Family XIII bacterium]
MLLITLCYTSGIVGWYVFRVSFFTFVAVGSLALLLFGLRYSLQRSGRLSSNIHAHGSIRFLTIVCVLFLFLGGLRCAAEFKTVDPLADWATLPYNNLPDEFLPKRTDAVPLQHGRILSLQKEGDGYCDFVVRSDHRNVLLRVKAGDLNPSVWIGRKISFTGRVEIPSGRRNPGGFDYALYLRTKGIHAMVNADAKDVFFSSATSDRLGIFISKCMDVKYQFLARARNGMSAEAYGIFAGMLFGDKSDLSEETYDLFRMTGIAHLLCVSGIHVAILYAVVQRVLGRRRTIFSGLLALLFLFSYAFFSEFSPSVCRASLMIALHIVSRIVLNRYDLTTGIAVAAFLLLLYRPAILFSSGFQLSFLCILVLAFCMPLLNRYIGYRDRRTGAPISRKELRHDPRTLGERGSEFAGKTLLPLLILQLGMAPMTAYTFCYLPLAGTLLNIPFVAMASIILPIGLFLFAVSAVSVFLPVFLLPLFEPVFRLALQAETVMIDFMFMATKWFCTWKFAGIQVVSPHVQIVFLFYCALFLLTSEGFRIVSRRRIRWILPMVSILCVTIALASLTSPVCQRNKAAFTFLDVGQGDCLHIRTPDNRNFLVDGGGSTNFDVGKKTLLPYLLKNGIDHLDGVFVSHLHTDHFEGLRQLSLHMDIGKVYLYEANRVR